LHCRATPRPSECLQVRSLLLQRCLKRAARDRRAGSFVRVVNNNPGTGAVEFDPDLIVADRFGAP
jgi:hypothetical protein